jgi:hypothetical protein
VSSLVAQSKGSRNRPAVWCRDAAAAGVLYAFGYFSVTYFLDHPLHLGWLVWPAPAVACLVFAGGWKGIGDRPWFVWTMALIILAVAVTGALQS